MPLHSTTCYQHSCLLCSRLNGYIRPQCPSLIRGVLDVSALRVTLGGFIDASAPLHCLRFDSVRICITLIATTKCEQYYLSDF